MMQLFRSIWIPKVSYRKKKKQTDAAKPYAAGKSMHVTRNEAKKNQDQITTHKSRHSK